MLLRVKGLVQEKIPSARDLELYRLQCGLLCTFHDERQRMKANVQQIEEGEIRQEASRRLRFALRNSPQFGSCSAESSLACGSRQKRKRRVRMASFLAARGLCVARRKATGAAVDRAAVARVSLPRPVSGAGGASSAAPRPVRSIFRIFWNAHFACRKPSLFFANKFDGKSLFIVVCPFN